MALRWPGAEASVAINVFCISSICGTRMIRVKGGSANQKTFSEVLFGYKSIRYGKMLEVNLKICCWNICTFETLVPQRRIMTNHLLWCFYILRVYRGPSLNCTHFDGMLPWISSWKIWSLGPMSSLTNWICAIKKTIFVFPYLIHIICHVRLHYIWIACMCLLFLL